MVARFAGALAAAAWACLSPAPTAALQPVSVLPDQPVIALRDVVEVLEDPAGALSIEQVAEDDARFHGNVGLALVRRIIDGHDGRIWVESEGPGAGSSFCFVLAAERP